LNEIISHFPSFFFCWGLFLFEWSSSHVQLLYT
jgi:hypothetical protein